MRQLAIRLAMAVAISLVFPECTLGQAKTETLGSPDAIIYDMKLIQEKNQVIANLGDKIEVWDYQSKKLINSWRTSRIISIDYFGDWLAGASKTGNIVIWNLQTGAEVLTRNISASPLISIVWIDSDFIVVGGENGDIMKVNRISGEIDTTVKTSSAVTTMSREGDDSLITGNEKGVLSIYRSKDLKLQGAEQAHKSWIRDIKFSDSSQYFITTSDDGYYGTWKTGKELGKVDKNFKGNWITCADFINRPGSKSNMITLGKSNGEILVLTRLGNYHSKMGSPINCIAILRSKLPSFVFLVGTHGTGMQLLRAKEMGIN